MKIQGKVAFITGTNRGLGRSLLDALLARGVGKVYAASRSGSAHADARVVPVKLDITKADEVKQAVARASDVNLLINNAGVNTARSLSSSDSAAIAYDMAVNYTGVVGVMQAFAPTLIGNAEAAMLNVLSVVSLAPIPFMGGYSASKAAQWAAVQCFRAELRSKKVMVHAAFPGAIETDMTKGMQGPMSPPDVVARGILDGLEAGHEDITPDGMSADLLPAWAKDPKAVSAMLASFG